MAEETNPTQGETQEVQPVGEPELKLTSEQPVEPAGDLGFKKAAEEPAGPVPPSDEPDAPAQQPDAEPTSAPSEEPASPQAPAAEPSEHDPAPGEPRVTDEETDIPVAVSGGPLPPTGGDRDSISAHPELRPTSPEDPDGVPEAGVDLYNRRGLEPEKPDTFTDEGFVGADPDAAKEAEIVAPEERVQRPPAGTAPGNTATRVPANAVRVDSVTRRTDDDALEGHFVKVVNGEHEGQIGAYVHTLEHDEDSGYPVSILVRFRDATYKADLARVPYEDVRPAYPYVGGR